MGLMGKLAQSVREADGTVLGIATESLVQQDVAGPLSSDTRVVSDTHERKASMPKESDAFIALPGGSYQDQAASSNEQNHHVQPTSQATANTDENTIQLFLPAAGLTVAVPPGVSEGG